jgi:hypothetical protein
MPPKNDYQVITEKTFAIPLFGTVVLLTSVVGPLVGFSVWLTTAVNEIRTTVRSQWTLAEQREFIHELQSGNPTIKVPKAEEIRDRINSNR